MDTLKLNMPGRYVGNRIEKPRNLRKVCVGASHKSVRFPKENVVKCGGREEIKPQGNFSLANGQRKVNLRRKLRKSEKQEANPADVLFREPRRESAKKRESTRF